MLEFNPNEKMIDGDFTWESVKIGRELCDDMRENEIYCSYFVNKNSKRNHKVLRFYIGKKIYRHLDALIGNKILLLQDKNSVQNYLLVKSPQGRKLSQNGGASNGLVGLVSFILNRAGLNTFKKTSISYILNDNRTVRIILPLIHEEIK